MKLLAAVALAACSSRAAPTADPPADRKGSASAPPDASALRDAPSPRKVPVKVERKMPDPAWERAADVAAAR
ncbi:MAG TPA: hypothetical protein VN253_28495, partial [Kofleriaceae bacterium]|nr:hypothetical protein [Kofleriaceae bacterium]